MKTQTLCAVLTCILRCVTIQGQAQTYWKLAGNAGIDTSKNFLGTTDRKFLAFRTDNIERMRITQGGRVGIGIKMPETRLHLFSVQQLSLSSPGCFLMGDVKKYNITMDASYIQARYNGKAADLYLNYYGGTVYAGYYNKSYWGIVGSGKYEGLYGYSYDSSGIGTYGYSSLWHGVYGYTGGGLGTDPQGSSGVYGYNASYGYGVGGYCYGGAGVFAYSEYYDGVFARGNPGWYAGFFVGDVYSTGSFIPSDAGLKKNVREFSTPAMEIINKLHPRQYEYRQDGNYKLMNLPSGERFGLVADDVKKVLPGIVKQTQFNTRDVQAPQPVEAKERSVKHTPVANETVNFMAVNYTELIPVIIKGMQEQQAVIEKQQSVIGQQQQQINELKQWVESAVVLKAHDAGSITPGTGARLIQNVPNPFSESTTIRCYVPSSSVRAQLAVYNLKGQLIKSYTLTGGMNTVNIQAVNLAAGQYSYSLLIDGRVIDSRVMVIAD